MKSIGVLSSGLGRSNASGRSYDEAVRALSQRHSLIDSLRTRAGLLLSAAAITTSFLGAQALNDGGSGLLTWLALGCFVGLAIATLAILWPHSLEFTANPANVIANYIETEEPLSVSEIHRDLSLHMHRSYGDNLAGQQQLASFSLDQRASDRRGNPMDYRFGFEGVEFDLCMDL